MISCQNISKTSSEGLYRSINKIHWSPLVISLTSRTYSSTRCRGQEEGRDALFRKRKVLQLVSHWSRLYKNFLKEEERVRSFMKVNKSHLFLLIELLGEPLFVCRITHLFFSPLYLHLNVAYPPSSCAKQDKKPFVNRVEELCKSSLIFFFFY